MPYLDIADFRSGLDARKYKLSLPAGTLTALVNGHITAGGEIEKRKAFLPYDLPPGTFGSESGDSGIYVFGSRLMSWNTILTRYASSGSPPSSSVVGAMTAGKDGYLPQTGDTIIISATDPTFNGSFVVAGGGAALAYAQAGTFSPSSTPATVSALINSPAIYQRLVHPDGVTQMVGVIYSTSFGVNPFVIAEFADGNSFFYFAGTIINDFQAGLIWSGSSDPFSLLTVLAAIINGTTTVNGLPQKNYPYVAEVNPLPATLDFTISGGTPQVVAVAAFGTLAIPSANNPAAGDLVVLGSTTYRFVSTLSGSSQNDVLRGGNASASASHLYHAILCDTGAGSMYNASTVANPVAAASALNPTTSPYGFLAAAIVAGTSGNSIASTINTAGASWTSGTTLSGGVDAVAAAGQILSVYYSFPTIVQLTANFSTNSALIVQAAIPFATNAAALAALVATAVGNATDAYGGGNGDNLGFTATSNGAVVSVTPPSHGTPPITISPYDSLSVYTDAFLTATTSPIINELLITSVPTTESSSPFALTVALQSSGASETDTLLNVGSPIVPATFASGSFLISACNISTQAIAVLSSNGSNVGAGDTITIGATTYTFVTALKGAAVNSVLIGSNAQASMNNLIAAMAGITTAGGGSGTTWAAGTAPNPDVTAGALVTGFGGTYYFTVTAILGGLAQNQGQANAINLSLSSASLNWWTTTAMSTLANGLTGGANTSEVTQITIGTTPILSVAVPATSNSPVTLANDICTAINNYAAISGYSASNVNGLVTVSSTTGGVAANALSVTISVSGAVCIDNAEFLVSGTGGITSIAVAGGPPNLLSVTTLAFQQSGHAGETLIQFCARVRDNINNYTGTTGYVAASDPNSALIWISRASAASSDAPSVVLTITSTLICTATTVSMQATASPAVVVIPNPYAHSPAVTVSVIGGSAPYKYSWTNPYAHSPVVTVSVIGGSAPYKYSWTFVSSTLGSSSGITSSTPAKSSTVFGLNLTGLLAEKSFTETWLCQVTDSSGTPVTVNSSQVVVSYTKK